LKRLYLLLTKTTFKKMSVALLPYICAEAVQIGANRVFTLNPKEPSPEVQFLTSTINTNRVLETIISDGSGHYKSAKLIYTPRKTEGETKTVVTADCNDCSGAGDLSHTYTIDPTVGYQDCETFKLADLACRAESDPDFLGRRMAAMFDVARRAIS